MNMIERRTKRLISAAALAAVWLGVSVPGSAQDDAADDVAVVDDRMWALATNGENLAWDDANEYCETLELAGFSDWRLPTLAELETLYDPAAEERGRVREPLELDDCCAWSSTSLVELEAEAKGVLPEPSNDPADYYWGFLFPSGVRYYSFGRFPDGQAMCMREPSGD